MKVSAMILPDKTKNLNKDATGQGALVVSVVRYEEPVGKKYGYKDGMVTKAASHRSLKAEGETERFGSFEDFVTWRINLTSECMLVSGTLEEIGKVPVVHKGNEGPGDVSASKKYLAHRQRPGLMIIDIDFKDPSEVAGLFLGGDQPFKSMDVAVAAFSKILPEADKCALLVSWSTSSNIFKDGKQVKGTGGIRIYLPVTDASKIPELLDVMHKRSWLNGEGWAFIDNAGRFQERSFVDIALGRPTQPDFAAPDLRDGLIQKREWKEYEGLYLDPECVARMTAHDEEKYLAEVAIAKAKLAPDMEAQRAIRIDEYVEEKQNSRLSPQQARSAAVQLLDNATLLPGGSVLFDDGTVVSILDLLTDGSAYDGKTCRDPVEPDYNDGASVGKYYWNDGEGPGIHSFAHGSTWYAIKHNATSAEATFNGGDRDVISLAIAQTSFTGKIEESQLEKSAAKALSLGQSLKPLRDDIAEIRKRIYAKAGKKGLEATSQALISEGRWPIDKPLPPEIFRFRKGNTLIGHRENYKIMMAAYGHRCAYDVIKKGVCWTGPQVDMNTDNALQLLFSTMKSLAALNELPHGNAELQAHIPAIAEENQINPVRDYLAALEWDKKDRFKKLADAMRPHDTAIAEIALRVWFTGAAAACEHFATGLKEVDGARPSFEYVLALLGAQGANKTKGFLRFVPEELGKYAKDGLSLKPRDKDSVKIAVSNWLVELGELDATFGQGRIADLKAFLSTEADEFRLPYAQAYSKFKRRTAFIGTVNQDKFLKDATGNRRYLALECDRGFPSWPPEEVDQLWAQAWARYTGGAQWWPSDEEQKLLDVNAERFRQHSWAEERIRDIFDFSHPTKNNRRVKQSDLLGVLRDSNCLTSDGAVASTYSGSATPLELADVRTAMKKLWAENGAFMNDGEQLIRTQNGTVKTYADGGKNKGWLTPVTFKEVEKEDREITQKLVSTLSKSGNFMN